MVGEAATIEAESIEAAGYELGDTLGEGRFSQVVRATHLASGEQYAVKIVDLESIAEDEEARKMDAAAAESTKKLPGAFLRKKGQA